MRDEVLIIDLHSLQRLVQAILIAAGATAEEASTVGEHVVDAEARGTSSQGLLRLPTYVKWAEEGVIKSGAHPSIESDSASTFVLDAHNGWGQVAALYAMQLCLERAGEKGTAIAVVRNANHIGRLGHYVEVAARHDMIGLVACSGNPASSWVAPWGGTTPVFGTNPIAIGFPRKDGPPIVVDISTTQGSRGNVLLAQASDTELPMGWAFDNEGNPTQDPRKALPPDGTLAPLGGHKGYALAVAIEILCGALAGKWPPASSANFVGAIRVDAFLPLNDYQESLETLIETVKDVPTRTGAEEIRLPGEGSANRRVLSFSSGLRVPRQLWSKIVKLAEDLGVQKTEFPEARP